MGCQALLPELSQREEYPRSAKTERMQANGTGERTGSRPKPPEAVALASLEPGRSQVQSTQLLFYLRVAFKASGATAPRECCRVGHPSRRIAEAMLLRMRPEHAVQDPHGEEARCAVSIHEAGKLLSFVARDDWLFDIRIEEFQAVVGRSPPLRQCAGPRAAWACKNPACATSVLSSAGNMHSSRNSSAVTVCGVPTVVISEK